MASIYAPGYNERTPDFDPLDECNGMSYEFIYLKYVLMASTRSWYPRCCSSVQLILNIPSHFFSIFFRELSVQTRITTLTLLVSLPKPSSSPTVSLVVLAPFPTIVRITPSFYPPPFLTIDLDPAFVSAIVIIDALLTGFRDGLDILNLSLGSPFGWTTSAIAVVASRIAESGIIMCIAAGNDVRQLRFSMFVNAYRWIAGTCWALVWRKPCQCYQGIYRCELG